MKDLIARLRELEAKATPEPYELVIPSGSMTAELWNSNRGHVGTLQHFSDDDKATSELIVETRNALPQLLAELEKRDKYCDEIQQLMAGALAETVAVREQLAEAEEVLEWYAGWDWSDKYVQAVPKKAHEFLKKWETNK